MRIGIAASLVAMAMAGNKGKVTTAGDVDFTSLGRIRKKLDDVSYIQLGNFNGEDYLMATENAAAPWSDGSISIVKKIKEAVVDNDVSQLKAKKLDTSPYKIQWANNAKPVPDEVFNDGVPRLLVPDGFLIPGHRDGAVYLINLNPDNIGKATST